MNKIIKKIKEEFKNIPDLKIKEIDISMFQKIYVVFMETICDSNKINDYILKNLTNYNKKQNLESNIAGSNTVKIAKYDLIEYYLTNGFAIVIKDSIVYAVEVKGSLNRNIPESLREPSLLGPEDAFNENYQTNIGLIKRRVKSNNLKTKEFVLGRYTKTTVGVLYIEGIAKQDNINSICQKLNKIDVDGIIDAGSLINYLDDENKSVFPSIRRTERPDLASTALLEGKIVIITDTSPFALILPSFLVDFINPISDNYVKSINVAFIKLLREISFLISMMAPALFIAIINYNQETIPSTLLVSFITQKSGVPFPSTIEVLILLVICDILRESDLRFPSNFGSTISILGALIIGDAAVNASIVSPISIIIVALTFISSLIFTELEINNALRYYRYLFLILAGIIGLYGIFIGLIIFLINVISVKSLNESYFAPIAPFNKEYFFKTVLKGKDKNNTKRSSLFTKDNIIRGKVS